MEAWEHIKSKLETLESYVYVNSYNDDYDNICILSYYYLGLNPDLAFNKETIVRNLQMQVKIRDTSFENAYTRLEAIRNLFHAYSYQVITIFPKGDIHFMGNDHKKRSQLTLNFNLKLVSGSTVT